MATLKYSRQREAIKTYLASTKEHPSADVVYTHMREEFPNISLGTVYRNLNLLADLGEALKIDTPNGGVRYDGCVDMHSHFYCSDCGKVLDLDISEKQMENIQTIASNHFDGTIESSNIIFYGKCGDCKCAAEKNNH